MNELQERYVKPHLELLQRHIAEQTPRFTEALAAFLEHADDPIGLHVSNLRSMVGSVRRNVELADRLLAELDQLENRE